MKFLAIMVCAIFCFGGQDASSPKTPVQDREIADLHPLSLNAIKRNRKYYFEMPDGTVWNAYGEMATREAFPSRRGDATPTSRFSKTQWAFYGFCETQRWSSGDTLANFICTNPPNDKGIPTEYIYYINTKRPLQHRSKEGVKIVQKMGDVAIAELAMGPLSGRRFVLHGPWEKHLRRNSLDGEFFLARIPHEDVPTGHPEIVYKNPNYRLVRMRNARMNTEQLYRALKSNRTELLEWEHEVFVPKGASDIFSSENAEVLWTRTVIELEYKPEPEN